MRDDSDTAESKTQSAPLPTPDEIKSDLVVADEPSRQLEFERKFEQISIQAELEWAHLRGLRDHYKHKARWSWFLMGLMAAMIAFQSFLLGMVGAGVWTFAAYAWLLPALLVQNLAQIVGLAIFVVKALFKDMKGGAN
jgi:hypothetical protein